MTDLRRGRSVSELYQEPAFRRGAGRGNPSCLVGRELEHVAVVGLVALAVRHAVAEVGATLAAGSVRVDPAAVGAVPVSVLPSALSFTCIVGMVRSSMWLPPLHASGARRTQVSAPVVAIVASLGHGIPGRALVLRLLAAQVLDDDVARDASEEGDRHVPRREDVTQRPDEAPRLRLPGPLVLTHQQVRVEEEDDEADFDDGSDDASPHRRGIVARRRTCRSNSGHVPRDSER